MSVCSECDGFGVIRRHPRNATVFDPCEACAGTGYVPDPDTEDET